MLSTRIRLARNIEGHAFAGRSSEGERLRVLAQVRDAAQRVPSLQRGVLLRVDDMPIQDRQVLHERHLVSRELAGLDPRHAVRGGAALFVAERVGMMVNEEDHLRLQAVRSGLAIQSALDASCASTPS